MLSFHELTYDDLEFFLETRNECKDFLHNNSKFTLDDCKEWFKEIEGEYYLIKNNDIKIGYFRTSKFNEINKSIYVGSDININHRGKGFAKKIYSLLLQHLKEKYDIKIFHLEVLSHNEVGVSLYKKLGFDITNVVSDFTKRDGITIDNITMSLPIDEIKINYYDYIHNICY